jgi:surface antigen
MRATRKLIPFALVLSLAACENQGGGFNTPFGGTGGTVGTLGGAAAGGLLGSLVGGGTGNALAILGGTLAGGYLGNRLGNALDQNSRSQAAQAEHQAVVTNHSVTWDNPDTGATGRVTPKGTYTDAAGRTCRNYSATIGTPGQPAQTGTGTACEQPDGSWHMLGS